MTHPLREALREKSGRYFLNHQILTAAFVEVTSAVARRQRMRNPELLEALLTTLVSAAQAMAPASEWDDVGAILADELRARLTVAGDTGEHHARRMI